MGFEILEVLPYPDVVVVCCGGGGLLAGVAAAIKLSGCEDTRIYGVEPEGGMGINNVYWTSRLWWKMSNDVLILEVNLLFLFIFFKPLTACTMYKSFIEKKPVGMDSKSIASGLAPPFAGIIYFAGNIN